MVLKKYLVWAGLSCLAGGIISCGMLKKDKKKSKSGNHHEDEESESDPFTDSHNYGDIKLELLDGVKLSGLKKEIFEDVNAGKDVKRSDITAALVAEHVDFYNKNHAKEDKDIELSTVKEYLRKLRSAAMGSENQNEAKVNYQAELTDILGKTPVYNAVATTIGDIFANGELQCFSGTALHTIVMRGLGSYYRSNPVVIYENGHTLPGYLEKADDIIKLSAVEMTVLSLGFIDFGDVKKIDPKQRYYVDGEDYALLELYKFDLANGHDVAVNLIERSGKEHGSDFGDVGTIVGSGGATGGAGSKLTFNHSPMGFGSIAMIDAPKALVKAKSLKTDEGRGQTGTFGVAKGGSACKAGSKWKEMPQYNACLNPNSGMIYTAAVDAPESNAYSICQALPMVSGYRWSQPYFSNESEAADVFSNVKGLGDNDLMASMSIDYYQSNGKRTYSPGGKNVKIVCVASISGTYSP